MGTKRLTLGVFGFGCVGSGLYETLRKSGFDQASIKRICIKDDSKTRTAPYVLFTTDKSELLNDPEIDVIVELIDDAAAAFDIVKEALLAGKSVVSANKKMIAEHLQELLDIQVKTGSSFLYEAACAASIPIIRNLEEYYDNDLLEEVSGVLNGSTNFILSALEEGGTYEEALALAQDLGFAESDPSLDVEGWDAKYKTTLLLAHSFGLIVPPNWVPHLGITGVTESLQGIAHERRQQIKLVGKCWREDDLVHASVLPTFVDAEEDLAHVHKEVNGVTVVGAFSERQFFRGKGAGSLPTAAAVMSDISALTYGYKYEYKKHFRTKSVEFSNDFDLWAHVSVPNAETLPLKEFKEVHQVHKSTGISYIEGLIGIGDLLRFSRIPGFTVAALSSTTSKELSKKSNRAILSLNA